MREKGAAFQLAELATVFNPGGHTRQPENPLPHTLPL